MFALCKGTYASSRFSSYCKLKYVEVVRFFAYNRNWNFIL